MIMRSLLLLQACLVANAMPSHKIPPGLQAKFAPGLEEVSTVEQNLPCTLYEQVIEYEGGVDGSQWVCEVFGIDAKNAGSSSEYASVKVVGMDKVFKAKSDIASGRTTMLAKGARFQNGNLVIGNNNNGNYGNSNSHNAFTFGDARGVGNAGIRRERRRRGLAATTGDLQVLVVRVSTLDESMSKDIAEISGDVFGTPGSGDTINLKSSAEGCSNGLVTINPGTGTGSSCVDDSTAVFNVPRSDPGFIYNCDFFNNYMFNTPGDLCDSYGTSTHVDGSGETANTRCCICGGGDAVTFDNGVVDGVMNLQLSITNTAHTNITTLEAAATSQLETLFQVNSLSQKFDNVMLCFPWGSLSGGSQNWVAYAYVGGTVSVYNGDFHCANEDNQMHEVGHNWGLRHSTENGYAYGDVTGYMGFTASAPDDQIAKNKMCYNGAHSWQLGWYIPYNSEIDPLTTSFDGTLVGVDRVPNLLPGETLVLKLANSLEDYYIMYNHAVGVNEGTNEAPNQVTITTKELGDKVTVLVSKLTAGSHITFTNWDGTGESVTVMVTSTTTDPLTGNAGVEVWKGAFGDRPGVPAPTTPSPTDPPTPGPTPPPTPPPTPGPTSAPTPSPPPTPGPTPAPTPTPPPTPEPTPGPTKAPTLPPTPGPTTSPTPGPTKAPTLPPTPPPTSPPTPPPTPPPTTSPTPGPTKAPTLPPTPPPTSPPTPPPTPGPTTSPTPGPTKAPTPAPTPAPTQTPTVRLRGNGNKGKKPK